LDRLQDTGGRENHRCTGLTVSRKLPDYNGSFKRNRKKMVHAGGRKDLE
jgi:hypothetical protein